MSKQPRLLRAQLAPGPGKGAQRGSTGARQRGTLYPGCPSPSTGSPREQGPSWTLRAFLLHMQIANKHPWANRTPRASWSLHCSQTAVPGEHPRCRVNGLARGTVVGVQQLGSEGWQGFTFPNFQQGCPAPQHKALGAAQRRSMGKPSLPWARAPYASGSAGIWGDSTVPPLPSRFSAKLPAPVGGTECAGRAPRPSASIPWRGEGVNARQPSRRWAQE